MKGEVRPEIFENRSAFRISNQRSKKFFRKKHGKVYLTLIERITCVSTEASGHPPDKPRTSSGQAPDNPVQLLMESGNGKWKMPSFAVIRVIRGQKSWLPALSILTVREQISRIGGSLKLICVGQVDEATSIGLNS